MKSESGNEYQVYSRRYSENTDYKTQVREHIRKIKKDTAGNGLDNEDTKEADGGSDKWIEK